MTDRKFKAPDGKVYDESFLIERYGQEKFDAFVSDNSLEEISTVEESVLDEDEFTAPDGKKYTESFLVERYGQEKFDSFVEEGSLKKKDVIDSNSSVGISEFQGFNSIPKPKPKTIDELGMYPTQEEADAAFQLKTDEYKKIKEANDQREAERKARFDITDEEALSQLKQKELKDQEQVIESQKKESDIVRNSQEFQDNLSEINAELTFKEQNEVAALLNKKFGKYGFIATPAGQYGRDVVVVRTLDGKDRTVVEVDNFTFDGTGEPTSKKLKDFINSNARSVDDRTEVQTEEDLVIEDELNKAIRAKQIRPVAMVNSNGTESTVKFMSYEEDGKYYVAPTLFPKDPDNPTSKPRDWYELNMEESIFLAKQRGEVFEFDTEEQSQDFAEGSWKNVSTADIEADKFYADRGLDYMTSRKAYDDYQDLSEEIDFIEGTITGELYDKRYEEGLTKEEKEQFGDLYVNGRVRLDAEEYLKDLESKRDKLSKFVMQDESQIKAREDFDEYLIDRVQKTATVAAESNRDARVAEFVLNKEIEENLGVSIEELLNFVPQNEAQSRLKDKYTEDLVTVNVAKEQAAAKYEVANTFYSKKVNKSLQGDYVDNLEGFNTAVSNGYKRGQAMEVILAMALGIEDLGVLNATNSKEENAKLISKYLGSQSPNLSRVSARFAAANTGEEVTNVILDNPLEWMFTLAGESLSQLLPYGVKLIPTFAGVGAGTGAIVGSVAPGAGTLAGGLSGLGYGARTGFALTSFAMEYTNSVLDGLEKNNYNYLDPQQVEKGLEDQRVWDYANDVGVKRGAIIGSVDFLSAGLAGRVFKPSSKLISKGSKIGLFAAERAIYDPAAEGFGEYLAQIGSGQEVDFKEIIAEMGGAGGNNVSMASFNIMMDARRNTNLKLADFLANDLEGMVNDVASDSRVSNWANNMLKLGKINDDQAQRIQENVGIRRQINELLNVSKAAVLSSPRTKKARARLAELIDARNQLTQSTNTKEIFRKKISDINAEIAEIAETNKIPEQQSIDAEGNVVGTGVNLNSILGKTERGKAAKYVWGGKMLTKEKFLKKIDNLTSKQFKRMGSTTVVGDPEIAAKLKAKIDAIQESSTKKVDVPQQAEDGKALGEGDTKIDITAEEGTQVKDETQTQQAITIGPTPVEVNETIAETFTSEAVVENVIIEETQEPTGVQVVTKPDNTFAVVENDVVIEDNIETKEAALDVANKTAPVFRDTPEAEVEVDDEVVYEMNKTNKKIWSKDFEILDNRQGQEQALFDEEGNKTSDKWWIVNKVTGQIIEVDTKAMAKDVIANAPAYAEAFGDGTKVEANMLVTPAPEAEVEAEVELAPSLLKPLKKHKTAYENNTLEEADRRGIIAYALDKKSKGKRLTGFENTILDTSNQETVSDIQILIEDIDNRQRQRQEFDQEVADLEAFVNQTNPQFQLSTKVTPENKKKELEAEALRLMENFEEDEMAAVAFSVKKLKQTKDALPENYWTVSEVEDKSGLIPVEVEGGSGFVDSQGDIKGVYKFTEAVEKKVKGVADRILKKAVDFGGIKLDNFDNYLTDIYKRNGFRVVSRTPFNEEYAPEGWNKDTDGTPDVIAMVYDPDNVIDIEEKTFSDPETGYDQMIEYRDSVIQQAKNKAIPSIVPIEIKEGTKFAEKVKRMGLFKLIGKKINLVMADQLVANDRFMGGPMFPYMDKLFGKVAWASITEMAAKAIIKGAIKSDYTVVFNMSPTAIIGNEAFNKNILESLDNNQQKDLFSEIQRYVAAQKKKLFKKEASESTTLKEFFDAINESSSAKRKEFLQAIIPTTKKKSSTDIGIFLENIGFTMEKLTADVSQDFVANLPVGALTTVIEVTDKNGNKVTKETADEALITPEDQENEDLPKHDNYPYFIRGKAVAILEETTPFWNMVGRVRETIEKKVTGVIKRKATKTIEKGKKIATKVKFTAKQAYNDAYYQAQLNADKIYTFTDPKVEKYSQFINLLKKSFPSVEVVDTQEGFDNLLANPEVVALTTKGQRDQGKVYGAVFQGKLYLNPAAANLNTPIHEFGHIWNNIAKQQRPELYNKGLELIESDNTYVKQIENSAEYQRVIKQMKKEGRTEQEIREFILEEALATAIGDKGESFANAAVKADFKNWLKKLYRFVKSMVGLSQYTDEQIQNITLDQFLQGVVVDLLSGEQVFKDAQVKEFPGQLQLMTGISLDETSMTTIISAGREQGFSDAVIKEVLKGRGFKATDINKAMVVNLDNTLFNDVVVPVEFGNMEGGMEEGQALFDKIRKKLKSYAQPRTTRRTRRETDEERQQRVTTLRAASPTLFAMTDEEILSRYPRIGVTETITVPPKTKSEIRAKALELLKAEASFQAQPETTQRQLIIALDKTIGTRANKVVSQEINALKQRIKDYQQGIKDIQEAKRILRNYIRKALPKSNLYTRGSITKIVSRIAKATPATILSDVEYVNKQVDAQREIMKKSVIKKMAKLVSEKSKKRITEANKAKSKGIAAEAQSFFQEANNILKLVLNNDTDGMLKILEELSVNEDVITQAIIKEINGKKLTADEQRLINLSYAFDNFSDLGNMTLEETTELYNAFKDLNAEGIRRFKSRRAARAEQIAEMNKQGEVQIKEGFPEILDQDGNPKNTNQLAQDRVRIEKLYAEKKYLKWAKEYVNHYRFGSFAELIRGFKNNLKHLGTLTNNLDKKGSFFTDNVYRRLNLADESNMKGYFRTMNKLDDIANSVGGITKGFREIRNKIYESGTMDIRTREALDDGTLGPPYTTTLSRDKLLRIYALHKNENQREKLERQGFGRATINDIEAFLGKDVTEFADKIVYFLSNEYYNETNDVYRAANDVNLNYVQNYFPTQTVSTSKKMTSLLADGDFNAIFNAESAPALKRRSDNKGNVNIDIDFSATLIDHVKAMERYKAYAIPTKMLQGVFSDPYVRSLLESLKVQKVMRQAVNYAINPDSYVHNSAPMRFITSLQSKYTSFALALKFMQIPKQMSSFVNAFENYSFRKEGQTPGLDLVMFMVDASMLYANLLAEIAVIGAEKVSGKHIGLKSRPLTEAMGMSGSLRKRIELGVQGDLVGLEAGQPTFKNIESNQALWAKLGRGGRRLAASPTVIGDIAGVMGYMINYRRNIKNGMSKAKALEEFNDYNATQQSRRATEKIPLQMNANAITRSLLMFGSTLFLQMNKVMSSGTNIMRGMKDVGDAMIKGDIKKAKEGAKNIKIKDIRGLYLNLAVANVMFTLMANMFKITSDDPEDREEALQRMRDAMFGLNLLYAIPFFEFAEQAVIDSRGGRRKVNAGVNPLGSIYSRIKNEIKYEDSSAAYAISKNLLELGVGVQFDPMIGLAETFTGGFDEETMYDMLGVSYSYRPGTKKKKSNTSSSNKSNSGGIDMTMDGESSSGKRGKRGKSSSGGINMTMD